MGTTEKLTKMSENHEEGQWGFNLLSFYKAPLTFFWACIVPLGIPCLQAEAAKLAIEKETRPGCKAFTRTFFLCCVGMGINRSKVRENFHIEGGVCWDIFLSCVCPCCTTVQEWREVMVQKNFKDDEPIWRARKGYARAEAT
mmetsp:Transcript_3739/g.5720  ORF Transcript_3739/g.5720 Transcript_3739/m.5720 type:complete len:142 (+) Transcript_3739:1264-1689(+)